MDSIPKRGVRPIVLAFLAFGVSLFLAISGHAASLQEKISIAKSRQLVLSFSNLTMEAEAVWPTNNEAYFRISEQLGTVLENLAQTNSVALTLLRNQSTLALEKRIPTNPILAVACYDLKVLAAQRLARLPINPNLEDAELLATFLGEIRRATKTNYQRATVVANVAPPIPPAGTNRMGVFAGMSPEAISDPEARAAYVKAIGENGMRACENDLQFLILPAADRKVRACFFGYTDRLFRKAPELRAQINKLAGLAHLRTEELKHL